MVGEMILALLIGWRDHLRLKRATATATARTPTTALASACSGGGGFKGSGVSEAVGHFSQAGFNSIIGGWGGTRGVPGVIAIS